MTSLKNKLTNTKANFSKNLINSIIIPVAIIVFALVIGIVFGFNKGLDFNGGIMLSVVADTQNLEDGKEYSEFKSNVDSVLAENKVGGTVYLLEKDSVTYKDVLVVKIAYNGNEEDANKLVESIKSGLISEFYSETSESEIEYRNLVNVSTFGPSVDSWVIVSSILATLITVLLISVYVGLRKGLITAVLSVISSVASNVLAFALLILTRVQLNAYTLAIIPFIAIMSIVSTYMFTRRASNLVKTDKYERKPNSVLANDTVAKGLYSTLFISGVGLVCSLAFALVNILNPVIWFGLAIFAGILAVLYTSLYITPAIFALTYVRRVKREKTKKDKKSQELNETEILQETDLDNLVSN